MELDKSLVIFDFDKTLIKCESYDELLGLIKDSETIKKAKESCISWIDFNDKLCHNLKAEGINIKDIKKHLEKLELNDNVKELLEYLRSKIDSFKTIILSGSMNIIIKWVLEYNGFPDLVSEIHSHQATNDDEEYLKFIHCERRSCDICQFHLCKATFLTEITTKESFKRIIYVGDGLNDYCAAIMLKNCDTLFPRKDYKLYQKLYEENGISNLQCQVIAWDNAMVILEHIK